jgi:hypothetical protein
MSGRWPILALAAVSLALCVAVTAATLPWWVYKTWRAAE